MRLVTSFLALAMAIGAFGVPGAPKAIDPATVTIEFAPATASGTLQPGQDLVLTGVITNPTASAIPAGTATVSLTRGVVSSTKNLTNWLGSVTTAESDKPGTQVLQVPTPEIAAGGLPVPISITVPAANIGLTTTDAWGPRELAVDVVAGGSQLGEARSSIVWYPGGAVPSTRLAVAVPITVPHDTVGLIPADTLARYTAPGGLLSRQLDRLDEVDGRNVAIGIDPLVIASITILGNTAPESARQWLERLRSMDNDSFALSYADSDIAAASQAGANRVLAPTSFQIDPGLFDKPAPSTTPETPTPTPTPTGAPANPLPTSQTITDWPYTVTGLAWPGDNTVVEPDLGTFAASGLATTILDSGNVSFGNLATTPSVNASVGDHSVLVSNDVLSGFLRAAANATTELDRKQAVSSLSSALAVITRERPSDTRTLLMTLDSTDPGGDFQLATTLNALSALPWAGTATLADIVKDQGTNTTEATVVAHPESADRISSVTRLLNAEASVANFSSVLADPTVLTGERRVSLLALLSNSWTTQADAWTNEVDKYVAASSKDVGSVAIAKSGSQLLTSSRIQLRVTVGNTLDWPVTVYVTVTSPRGIITVEKDRVPITVQANSQATAEVPVEVLANGSVTVRASSSSATGVPIGPVVPIALNVSAGWEGAVTGVFAGLVVLVFGFGIWRNIAKRRKAKKNPVPADADAEDETPTTGSQEPRES